MLKKYLYKYSYINGYKGHLNEKNVIFCLIMWTNIWVSCPKTWVSYPRIWVSLPIFIWVSWFLGELSWYLGVLVTTRASYFGGWVCIWVNCLTSIFSHKTFKSMSQRKNYYLFSKSKWHLIQIQSDLIIIS